MHNSKFNITSSSNTQTQVIYQDSSINSQLPSITTDESPVVRFPGTGTRLGEANSNNSVLTTTNENLPVATALIEQTFSPILNLDSNYFSGSLGHQNNPLTGSNLLARANNNDLETDEFTRMLLGQINPILRGEQTGGVLGGISQSVARSDWEIRARNIITRNFANYLAQNNVRVNSSDLDGQMPNVFNYVRVLTAFFKRIEELNPDSNELIRSISSNRNIFPRFAPEHMVPLHDSSLFLFLNRTVQISGEFVSQTLHVLTQNNSLSIIAFSMFAGPVLNVLMDSNLRPQLALRLSLRDVYQRIRNTFFIFESLTRNSTRIERIFHHPQEFGARLVTRLRESFDALPVIEGSNFLLSIQNRVTSFIQNYLVQLLISGVLSSLGIYFGRDQVYLLLRTITEYFWRKKISLPGDKKSFLRHLYEGLMKGFEWGVDAWSKERKR